MQGRGASLWGMGACFLFWGGLGSKNIFRVLEARGHAGVGCPAMGHGCLLFFFWTLNSQRTGSSDKACAAVATAAVAIAAGGGGGGAAAAAAVAVAVAAGY